MTLGSDVSRLSTTAAGAAALVWSMRVTVAAPRVGGLVAEDLHAQTAASGFYERLGYAGYGDELYEAGIAHLAMRRAL